MGTPPREALASPPRTRYNHLKDFPNPVKTGPVEEGIMRPTIAAALAGLIFTATLYTCYSQEICRDKKIVEGQSLGPLTLGMTVDEATHLVGKPELADQTGTFDGSEWRRLYYFPGSDFAIVARDGKIVEFEIGSGTKDTLSCSTGKGIRLGSKSNSVKKSYGAPDSDPGKGGMVQNWSYDKSGISFLIVDNSGQVLAIQVFTPGTYSTIDKRRKALNW
jgi:hypothetical protein